MTNGKGSKQRRRQVSRKTYESNWDAVFVKDPWEDGSAVEVAIQTADMASDGVARVTVGDKTMEMPGGTVFLQLPLGESDPG